MDEDADDPGNADRDFVYILRRLPTKWERSKEKSGEYQDQRAIFAHGATRSGFLGDGQFSSEPTPSQHLALQ
jgi:hypothetical protein